ncbi:MAG TPA: YetF domain-containing protein [Acidobacteriaceae bacterium]|jgi:uncharacterized membrane protein YcaP (DUF421 family)|nr:YetF domain-containing protein [Acidobacteriaceae bacterium]
MAIATILRAAFGYLFLVLIVRVVGRRPGKQLTPFEFVLIFYLGGLTLTGMVANELSLTNGFCQVLTVALCHYVMAILRQRSKTICKVFDGVPLVLLEQNHWRTHTLVRMRLQDDDVMAVARQQGIKDLSGIGIATLEAFGEISIIPPPESGKSK